MLIILCTLLYVWGPAESILVYKKQLQADCVFLIFHSNRLPSQHPYILVKLNPGHSGENRKHYYYYYNVDDQDLLLPSEKYAI